jgi:SAM-dependent methyltransferase
VRFTLPLRQVCGDDLPGWVRVQIDQNISDNTERFERIKDVYLEIATALRDADIEHLVLKGFAQWPAYMQGPHVRTQSDVDVFCPPESIFHARDTVCSLGYASHQDFEAKFVDHLPALGRQNNWQWRGRHFEPDIPISVELHFRLWNETDTRLRPMGLEEFWFRRIERQVDGFTCPALDPVDALAYAALHVLRSVLYGGLTPYHVYEIAWFLHTNSDDDAFWKKRDELHHRSLRLLETVCFRLANDWFGCRLPEEVEKEMRSLPPQVELWFQKYRDSRFAFLLDANKDALWLHSSLLESASDKWSVLFKGLFPAPTRPAEGTGRWTPRTYRKFVTHVISQAAFHARLLPRTLWHGFRWWLTNGPSTQFWTLRASVSSMVRKHRWLPPISVLGCTCALVAAVIMGVHFFWQLGTSAALAFACYFWGYATRAFKVIDFPSLLNLPRRQYGKVWDALAATPELAKAAACGHEDESKLRRSASAPVNNLRELAGLRPEDDVLEFGCGVARIGLELAPRCRTWTGADMSANMLATAAERLRGVNNVRLVQLQHVGLDKLDGNSFDLVYSTNMLPHLDEMDRWRYVKDAFRVLRCGGRLCIDGVDLESDEGWGALARGAESSQDLERPPYMPTPSTAAELTTYASRAGFVQIQAHKRSPLVIVTAVKPTSAR